MPNELAPTGKLDMAEITPMAKAFHESGMFPDIRSMAQAIVKIQAGQELGFNPIYSMTKIYIVKGRVMVGAEALAAMVKRSGRYDYKIQTLTDIECMLVFTDKGADVYTSRFTMDDARRADLVKPDSGWAKWPRAMLFSKCVSQGARAVCPEVISGVYTPEDFGYSTNPETQQIDGVTPENRAAMEKSVNKADETALKPTEQRQDGQGAALPAPKAESTQPQDGTLPAELIAKPEPAPKIDVDWVKRAVKTLKYQDSIFSLIGSIPVMKGLDLASKDLNKVLPQMDNQQAEALYKVLTTRAAANKVTLE